MLHGEIRVNGHPVAEWRARRVEEMHSTSAPYRYEVSVFWPPQEGIAEGFVEGVIEHVYADGAAALAAKILTWAAPQAPRFNRGEARQAAERAYWEARN